MLPPIISPHPGLKSWQQPDAVEKLHVASPTTYIHKGMPPFLFIQGTADEQVPYQQSPKMCEAMKKIGAQCEVMGQDQTGENVDPQQPALPGIPDQALGVVEDLVHYNRHGWPGLVSHVVRSRG